VINRLLLDTHVALWLDSGDDRLRAATRALIDGCCPNGGTIFLSAVTAWESRCWSIPGGSISTSPIDLDVPVDTWIERFLARPGIAAVPLSH
jgi:PIN domain nuclease of toxin-antitoxin system